MSGGGDDVAVFKRARRQARCHQSTDVSHVSQNVRIVLVSNFSKAFVIQMSSVTADAWKEQLPMDEMCKSSAACCSAAHESRRAPVDEERTL